MLGRKQKYEIVHTLIDDEAEIEIEKQKGFCTSQCLWSSIRTMVLISMYLVPSIGLTFYQRWLFQRIHFPLTVVLVHLIVKYVLAVIIRSYMSFKKMIPRIVLNWHDYVYAVGPPGIFSGIDIGFSNWGLELVTVSLYTMTKSTCIIFILAFALIFKLEEKSWSLCVIVIMISMGLFLFTYETTQFNLGGFLMLIFASASSGLRWTCVQMLMQKSRMGMRNPIDMVYHMQPWMMVSVLPFALAMEGPALSANCRAFRFSDISVLYRTILEVFTGAIIGFIMEISEILVVTYTSSLTLSIVGIGKEILMLSLAVIFTGDQISHINLIGLLLCLCGIVSHVLHKLRTSRSGSLECRSEFSQKRYSVEDIVMNDTVESISSGSEDELSDSQVLFDLLNRHDR